MMTSHFCVFVAMVAIVWLISGACAAGAVPAKPSEVNALVGKPVDIAPSAYKYRADCGANDNAPESWIAVKHFAKLPLNLPADPNAPAVKQVSAALLWEEVRPLRKLVLTWHADAKRKPAPSDLRIATLDGQGSANSWWNNLAAAGKDTKPAVSNGGRTYTYELNHDTCGIVVALVDPKSASEYDVPDVEAFVADTWKRMDVELEWGFDPKTASKDYSGRIEAYDGRLSEVHPLTGDSTTKAKAAQWDSSGETSNRRGVKFSLLYMGISKWRKEQPFTSRREDVPRTIVTVWTKAGNFSFLAADLENGPIYAPEYGFFVRRTSKLPASAKAEATHVPFTIMADKMADVAGDPNLKAWGSNETPWFGGNPADHPESAQGIEFPAKSVAMHPGADKNVAVAWCSPIDGVVGVRGGVAHAQNGSTGVQWGIVHDTKAGRRKLAGNSTNGSPDPQKAPSDPNEENRLNAVKVSKGDRICLVVARKISHNCCTVILDFVVAEAGGAKRVWNLTHDVVDSVQAANPHPDSLGNKAVWQFQTELGEISEPSEPPIELDSKATTAKEYEKELAAKKLITIRQQIRSHLEQTWDGAVTAMRGTELPPHPVPPPGCEPAMRVEVPSERLTAQWNLGAWHLMRHCEKNPKNGRLWFNDYPYGILGAETYMVLRVLDLMGAHKAAEDGLDQWVSLPLDTDSTGQHPWALRDRPNGLFTEGHGCMTAAVGPEGVGNHMDGVHAFGPGSIGWTLTEHYWMTGDKEWLKASAPRILANAEWMLRQRRAIWDSVPGGERLWCKGLQPPLQVTPDSGGLWMQFYECEAYYWASINRLAVTLAAVDEEGAAKLKAEAEAYRKDLRAAVDRSIALSPVVPIRDGTFHSVIPFACYCRGLSTGAWGWERDGSGVHVGPLYWETVQSAAALISPAGLLPADDVRVQGYLDVLEDRLLLENPNSDKKDWFARGWQYQGGLERTPNMHLIADDVPVFLRSFLNCYAVDILPNDGYIFNEHAVHGPPDKIFEEAAFLERLRNLLVMEEGDKLWLARATPRAWMEQGKRISVANAPTYFGIVAFGIESDVTNGKIVATVTIPDRDPSVEICLRLRHPKAAPMKSVTVDGKPWTDFDPKLEIVKLHGLSGTVKIEAQY